MKWWRRRRQDNPTPPPSPAATPPAATALGHSTPMYPPVGGEVLPESFGITPLSGWRTWRVVMWDSQPYLTGIRQWRWPSGEVEAICLRYYNTPPEHDAPEVQCSCGIYANLPESSNEEWWSHFWGRPMLYGYISMWGKVIRCDRGYRAEKARILNPLTLELTCRERQDPAVMTGTNWCRKPIHVLDGKELFGWCQEHVPAVKADWVAPEEWLDWAIPALSQRYEVEIRLGG